MLRFKELKGHNGSGAKAVVNYLKNERTEPRKEKRNDKSQQLAIGYYSEYGGAPSQWITGAEHGLSGKSDVAQLENLLNGIAPDGTDISGRGNQSKNRRMGYDLTFSAPKTVSIIAIDDERIFDAQDRATAKAMQYVQSLAYARIGKSGEKTEYTNSMLAVAFRHEDGRIVDGEADPHLHSHVVLANMTQRADGTWAALRIDWGEGNINQHLADQIYKAELARELKSLGYSIEITKDGFEIAGIGREQVEIFSRRSGQIKKVLSERGIDTPTAAQREVVQNVTRSEKTQLSKLDQHFEWRERLRKAGINAIEIRERGRNTQQQNLSPEQAIESAISHLSERETVFTRAELENAALQFGMGSVTISQIQYAITESKELIDAGHKDRDGTGKLDHRYTTCRGLHREADILARAAEGKGKAVPIIPRDPAIETSSPKIFPPVEKEQHHESKRNATGRHYQPHFAGTQTLSGDRLCGLSGSRLDANQQRTNPGLLPTDGAPDRSRTGDVRWAGDEPTAVKALLDAREKAQGWKFSQGQRAAVSLALTSKDRHLGIVGYAGAGKTTSMKIVVEEYQKAGYTVIGVAPSAAAAKELETAGCEARTLASILKDKEPPSGKTLYLLDEAGMVSASDYQAFFTKADKENARTLSVGDPLQLQSVEAGTAFKQLLESGSMAHVKIDEIQRQKDPRLKEIAMAFAKGEAAKGVALAKPYMSTVEVQKGEDRVEKLAEAAANRYLSISSIERSNTLLLAGTNATRQAINAKVRQGMIQSGELEAGKTIIIRALDKAALTKEEMAHSRSYLPGMVIDVGDGKEAEHRTIERVEDGKLLDDRGMAHAPQKVRQVYQPREMQVCSGEQIQFRQNDRERGIVNGSVGIVRIVDGQAAVRLQSGQTVPLSNTEVADYAYARTVHSAQGATYEEAIVVGEASRVATAESAYVACSREKTALQIITDNPEKLAQKWQKFGQRETAHHALGLELQKATPDKLPQAREALPDLDRAAEVEHARRAEQQKAQQQQDERSRQERDRLLQEQRKRQKQKGMDR